MGFVDKNLCHSFGNLYFFSILCFDGLVQVLYMWQMDDKL